MVTVSGLCVGKELLIGKTTNTNATWVGARLFGIGIMFDRVLTVTDSLKEISSGLLELLQRKPDFVLVFGGLGPTPDDMTLKGVSRALGRRTRTNQEAIRLIRDHYVRTGRNGVEMTPPRRKMARLPEGSTPLQNDQGTAPGVRMESGGSVIFCLPGVPREMKSIYTHSVHPEILRKTGRLFTSKAVMQLEGIYESSITQDIAEALKDHPSAYIKSHPRGLKNGRPHIELDMVVVGPDKAKSVSECSAIADFFRERVATAGGTITKQTSRTQSPRAQS
jgi:molybdopterin-biosynthesis enzyme MoeA-like protein